MASTVFPAATAASSKTMYRTTLTSGTSYTVPTGALYLNVKLFGGGGAGGDGYADYNYALGNDGIGGSVIASTLSSTPGNSIAYAIGAGGVAGAGGSTTFTGATTATGGNIGVGATGESAKNGGYSIRSTSRGSDGGSGKIEIEYWV